MKKITLIVSDKGKNIVMKDVFCADTFYERLKGLMFLEKSSSFKLLIKNCNSVHTCFMRFPLDIFCLDKNYNIIKIYSNIKPFRFILPVADCCHILEIPV